MIRTNRTQRIVCSAAAAASLAALASAPAAAADFSSFVGTWTNPGGSVTIGSGGSGVEKLADGARVAFQLTSVGDSVGSGTVTQSSNPADATVGTPVNVWTTALGDGPLLTIETGSTDGHYCSPAVVAGGECVA